MTTPSVTFNSYKKDGIITTIPNITTVSGSIMSGISDDKYIYSIIIDPFETTTENVSTHELIFDISPNGGTEGKYMSPFSHAGSGVSPHTGEIAHARYGGVSSGSVIETLWLSGVTSGSIIINPDEGFSGSGSAFVFSGVDMPRSGTVWNAAFGSSGSSVLDIPTIYYGSFVAINDPTDGSWDGNSNIHDFQMYQLHVGHNVDIADFQSGTMSSGVLHDNIIDLFKEMGDGGNILINIKTYHEFPAEWELINTSGTIVQSGTQSGTFVEDQWLFLNNLNLGDPAMDTNYTLKLYASGVIKHPTPLRTMKINIYVSGSSGRFGIGRFGIGRFGVS